MAKPKKLQKIYLDIENQNLIKNNLISLENFKNSDLKNVYKVISNQIVTSAIIGPRNLDQYEDNIGALGWEIESSILAKLDQLVPPGEHTGYGFNDPQNPVRGRPSR